MMSEARINKLTPELLKVVARVVSTLGESATTLLDQAKSATISSYSPTMINLIVPDAAARSSLPDGPSPGRAIVYDAADQPIGEIILWIRAGRMIGLEQAWYTDEPPRAWPSGRFIRNEP